MTARQAFLRAKDKDNELDRTSKALDRTNSAKEKLEEEVSALALQNKKIREEVALSGLTDMQVRLVEENSSDIERNIRPEFKLKWRAVDFEVLLGSGTFGDCYKGKIGAQEVAVSALLFEISKDISNFV